MRENYYFLKLCAFFLIVAFSKQLQAQFNFNPTVYYRIKQVSTTAVQYPQFGSAINVNDSVYWVANDVSLSYGNKSDGCYPVRIQDLSDSARSSFWTIDSTSATAYRFTNYGKSGTSNPYLSNWSTTGNDVYMGTTADNRYKWAVTKGTSGYVVKHSTGYYITTDLKDLTDIRGVVITDKTNSLGSAANIVITKAVVAKNAMATTLSNAGVILSGTPAANVPATARTRLTNAIPIAQAAYDAINASTVSVSNEFRALFKEYKAFTDSCKPLPSMLSSFQALLDSANTLKTNSVVGTAGGTYPAAAYATFSGAIDAAQTFNNSNPNYTVDVNTQLSTLKNAIKTFYSSIIIDGYYTISIGNRYVTEDTAGWQNATTYFPILKNGPTNDGTQWFKFTKETNGRYRIESFSINTALSYISGTLPYINESGQFGRNAYSMSWNSMNVYIDGLKYAIQGYANSATDQRSYDTATIRVTRNGMRSYCWDSDNNHKQAAAPSKRYYMSKLTPVTISQKVSWIVFPITYPAATTSALLTAKMMSNYGTTGAATYTIDSSGTSKPLIAGMHLNAGTYPVTVTFAADLNYPQISKTVNFIVNKTTPPAAPPISDTTVIQGKKLNEVKTFTGFTGYTAGLNGISFTVNGNAVKADTILNSSGTPYNIVVTFNDPNYKPVSVSFNLTVTSKTLQTIAISDPGTKTYGDSNFTLTLSNRGSGIGAITYSILSGTAATVLSDSTIQILSSGQVTIRAKKEEDATYATAFADLSLTINKAVLKIAAKDTAIRSGSSYNGFKYRIVNGLTNGDTNPAITGNPVYAVTVPNDAKVGDVFDISITDVSGISAINYSFAASAAMGKLTIAESLINFYYTIWTKTSTAVPSPGYGQAILVDDSIIWAANDASNSYGAKGDAIYPVNKVSFADTTRSMFWSLADQNNGFYKIQNLGSQSTSKSAIAYLADFKNITNDPDVYMGKASDGGTQWMLTSAGSANGYYVKENNSGRYISSDLRDRTANNQGFLIHDNAINQSTATVVIIRKMVVAKNSLTNLLDSAKYARANKTSTADATTALDAAIATSETALANTSAISVYSEYKTLEAAYETFSFGVQKSQTIAIGDPGAKTYGDSNFKLTLSNRGSGTGAITYSITSGTAATVVADSTIQILSAGSVTIRATKAADIHYLSAYVDLGLTINKAVLEVAAKDTSVRLGSSYSDFKYLIRSGLTNGDTNPTITGDPVYNVSVPQNAKVGDVYDISITDVSGMSTVNYSFVASATMGKLTIAKPLQTPIILTSGKITFYPNPVSNGYVKVEVPEGNGRIMVTSISGEIIISKPIQETVTKVDMSNFAPGIYLFQVKTPAEFVTKKVVKQ